MATKSKTSYDPFKDTIRTPRQKMELVFTERQKSLMVRPDVTKSLIIACTKVVVFKQDIDTLVSKWVGEDTTKFLRTLPLLVV